ncbi:hypothetical protein V2J09_011454 [Rumex salicifolius]
MATLPLHSEPRRLCSWLWDSHITPNNSKWLQENLTEMDGKVRAMIKIINEDADSFARRAEMYYKKRPELMRLIEDLYRAYRALAERYDHVTGELRLAHRTMPEAFPNQVNSVLRDDQIPSSTSEPSLPMGEAVLQEWKSADEDSISEQCSCLSADENQSCNAEDRCTQLENLNQLLRSEANDLIQRIAEKDQELFRNVSEVEELMNRVHVGEFSLVQAEATLDSLQNLHFQSLEEQKAMALELSNGLQMLENCKQDFESEIQQLREENHGLIDQKLAYSVAEREMENEILSLKQMREKLDSKVRRQAEKSNALERQVHQLNKHIEDLNKKYKDLIQQVESAGIDPMLVKSSINEMRDKNLRLEEISFEEKAEKEALLMKVEDMEEKSCILESYLSDVHIELESFKERMKSMQESCEIISGEKSVLVAEKSYLVSQLQLLTESIQNLSEKNTSLEDSLHNANSELEGLREKSNILEELCRLLNDEKSTLQTERSSLISQLKFVGKKVESFEMRFTKFEDRFTDLNHMEYTFLVMSSETRLSELEERIHHLQEEMSTDFEEQLEKAVNDQFEIFVLQKFLQEMAEKNHNLGVECQKHVEDKKYKESLMSELKTENMIQSTVLSAVIRQLSSDGSELAALKAVQEHEVFLLEEKNVMLQLEKDELLKRSRQWDIVLEALQKEHAIIQEEHSNALEANRCLQHKLSKFEEERVILDEEKSAAIAEALSLSFQSEVFMNSLAQKALEMETIIEELHCLHKAYTNTEIESRELMEKLAVKETENMQLRELNQQYLSELNGRRCDLELWEDVAVSYYYDLQACAVREALFESKVHELSGLCKILEDLNVRSCIEVERMKGKISFLESKNKGLEAQLAAYVPVASLEVHFTSTSKDQEFTVNDIYEKHPLQIIHDEDSSCSTPGTPGVMDETRIKDILHDHASDYSSSSYRRSGSGRSHRILEYAENTDSNVLGVDEPEISKKVTELNEVENGKVIIERLSSDAQELERLNLSVQELKNKIKTNKKSNLTKAVEYKRLSGQLQNIEDSIAQLVDVNTKLIKTINDCSSLSCVDSFEQSQNRKVTRQARKEAEKIGRLQLDVQKIQYLLLKLEDEENENNKGKRRSLRSRTGISLSDLLYSHGSRSRKQRKLHICGCDSTDVLDPRINKFVKQDTNFAGMQTKLSSRSPSIR